MFFIIIPSSCLLGHCFSFFQQLDLSLTLSLNCMSDCFKGVQVFHFRSCTKCIRTNFPNRKVYIRTHRSFLQLAVRCSQILYDHTEFLKICDHFLSGTHIRLWYNLYQRNSASVIINQWCIIPFIVNELSCIFLHMHFMDPHFFLSASAFNLYISISCDWKIKLGNLIVLRIIRIKIVLAVKFTYLRDLTVCCKSDRHRIFYNLLIQYRKRPRHTGADRAGMRIRCPTKFGTASTENLCLCC